MRVAVIFEGRDAAGKGGTIKRIDGVPQPRAACAPWRCETPTEREKTEWYFNAMSPHLPAAGEMVLFDRSWYNRPGVERVMGFCSEDESWISLRLSPRFEQHAASHAASILVKYWFSVSDARAGEALPGSRRRIPCRQLEAQPYGS